MEVQILEDENTKLKFKIIGETHTLCNLLKKELFNDKAVEFAGYSIEQPLIKEALFTVSTTKKSARKAVNDALERIKDTLSDFETQIKKI